MEIENPEVRPQETLGTMPEERDFREKPLLAILKGIPFRVLSFRHGRVSH
jgi:hypothetical protein